MACLLIPLYIVNSANSSLQSSSSFAILDKNILSCWNPPLWKSEGNWCELIFAKTCGTVTRYKTNSWLARPNSRSQKQLRGIFQLQFPPRFLRWRIDLIQDTRHLCTRLRNDGRAMMSRSFSGGKHKMKFANARNRFGFTPLLVFKVVN